MAGQSGEGVCDEPVGAGADRVYRNAFRLKRFATFIRLVDRVLARKDVCRIIDLGGEVAYWQGLRESWASRRLDVAIINHVADAASTHGPFTTLLGDARALPDFADGSFDIVHSNSVIEHVGGWRDMSAMAAEVRRLAPAYFVQTPNYWFPLEPHLRVPCIHWLPEPWRRSIVMSRACGFYPKARTVDEAHKILADASLLDAPAMAALFPDARLVRERVGPLTKSLIAIRDS